MIEKAPIVPEGSPGKGRSFAGKAVLQNLTRIASASDNKWTMGLRAIYSHLDMP